MSQAQSDATASLIVRNHSTENSPWLIVGLIGAVLVAFLYFQSRRK